MIKAEIKGGIGTKSAEVIDAHGYGTLASANPSQLIGIFKSVTHAAAATTAIITPNGGGSIVVTDILISAEKKALGTLTLAFTDGTNTINIMVVDLNDAPANFAAPVAGRFLGWKDARIDMTTNLDYDATVTIGYFKIVPADSLSYTDWDALR